MIYLSYFVEFGRLHYTRKKGVIAFLLQKVVKPLKYKGFL